MPPPPPPELDEGAGVYAGATEDDEGAGVYAGATQVEVELQVELELEAGLPAAYSALTLTAGVELSTCEDDEAGIYSLLLLEEEEAGE